MGQKKIGSIGRVAIFATIFFYKKMYGCNNEVTVLLRLP